MQENKKETSECHLINIKDSLNFYAIKINNLSTNIITVRGKFEPSYRDRQANGSKKAWEQQPMLKVTIPYTSIKYIKHNIDLPWGDV